MNQEYGTPEKISRRCDFSGIEVKPSRLETTGRKGQDDGTNQIIIGGENRNRRNSDWKLTPIRDTTAGKILERIETLEARHIKYVDSHQSRLNARLEESRQEKEEFLIESNQIKSDIYHLATAQNQSNGNGHIN